MSFDWNAVWTRKGNSDSSDHKEISGFEHLEFESEKVANNLLQTLNLQESETLLEIGCAAGMFARHFNLGCRYVGIDKVEAMVKKNITLNNLCSLQCEADDLIFKDKSFDKSFSFGVFHYFPEHTFMWKVVDEMIRVSRKSVLIADLPRVSHDSNHLLFTESMFTDNGWEIVPASFFRAERFDVIRRLD